MEGFDSLVKDMSLAEWGRKEIELAQVEMPGTDHSWRLIIIFYRFDGLPY
jgi:S-adenosylhomocysteine hydrolase